MTLYQRFRQLVSPVPTAAAPAGGPAAPAPVPAVAATDSGTPSLTPGVTVAYTPEPLPGWLADEDTLRDEGVLFGLSDARPDGKLGQIRAFFARQVASLSELADECTEKIGELNLFIEQRESRIASLQDQINTLRDQEPRPHNLLRTVVSLLLGLGLCTSNFYLIDETLRPVFPNQLVAVGIFLGGMFNLFSRTSFLYETGTRPTVRRVLAETGLPLAASLFVLVQALQTQAASQAIALFMYTLFLFLLGGHLFLSTLTSLQTEVAVLNANRRVALAKVTTLPGWEADIDRLNREVDMLRVQKWPLVSTLTHTQAELTRLNARRDELVNVFVSEFDLARSLRDRLSEQQRNVLMNL